MYTGSDSFNDQVKKTLVRAIQLYIDTSHNWQPQTENEHELMAEWKIYGRGEWEALRDRVPTLTPKQFSFDNMVCFKIACACLKAAVVDAMNKGQFELLGEDVQQLWGDMVTIIEILQAQKFPTSPLR